MAAEMTVIRLRKDSLAWLMSFSRTVAIRGISELNQFEEAFLGVFAGKDPEAIAVALRAFSCHLHSWSHSMMSALVLNRLDADNAWTNIVQICPNRGL